MRPSEFAAPCLQVGEALAEVVLNKNLKSTATLQTVLIHNNPKLRSKGLMPFFRALKEDAVMTTLNLANTSIGDEGADLEEGGRAPLGMKTTP